jgi:hypothetical protein
MCEEEKDDVANGHREIKLALFLCRYRTGWPTTVRKLESTATKITTAVIILHQFYQKSSQEDNSIICLESGISNESGVRPSDSIAILFSRASAVTKD